MSLGSIYLELLQQDLLLSFLREGVIPTKREIDTQIKKLIESNPNLDRPFLSAGQYNLNLEEQASASKFNQSFDNLLLDLRALYKSVLSGADESTILTEKLLSKLSVLEKRASEIEDRSGNLLLTANDIEGFVNFVFDNLSNYDKVDIVNTDIIVDNKTQTAQLPIDKYSRVSTPIPENTAEFNVITRNDLSSSSPLVNSEPANVLIDQNKFWIQHVLFTRPPARFIGELIIRLSNSVEASRIIIRPISSDRGSITNIVAQYSNDGLNWLDVNGENNKRLLTDTVFDFTPVKTRYFKFLFSKSGYDDFVGGNYIYEIGAKSIEFYGVEYTQTVQRVHEGTLISKPLASDPLFNFNKAALKVCEFLPEGTSIDYSLSFLDNSQYSNYQDGILDLSTLAYSDIDPGNRENPAKPLIVDGAQITRFQNLSSSYELDSSTGHKYKTNLKNVLVDTYILSSSVTDDSFLVWRNLGDNTLNGGGNTPVKVNNVDNGWLLQGDYYLTEFYISEADGRIVDFGPNSIELDGSVNSGRIALSQGVHKFRTHRKNWLSISPASIVTSTDPNPDILYPYNHKYLIEGLNNLLYGVDLTADLGGGVTRSDIIDPDDLYIPLNKYWGKTLRRVSLFDFAFNIQDNDYTVFTIVTDENDDNRIMIKYDTEPNLFTNEMFAIIEDEITGSLFSYVVLRAIFRTSNTISSPVLDGYTIRLGL